MDKSDLNIVAQHFLSALWQLLQSGQKASTGLLQTYEYPLVLSSMGTASEVVPANSRRKLLVFSAANSGTYQVSLRPDVPPGGGLMVAYNTPPLIVTARDWGALVTQSWYAIGSVPANSSWVVEGIEIG